MPSADKADDAKDSADKLGEKLTKKDLAAARAQGSGILEKEAVLSSGNFWIDYLSGSHDGFFPKATIIELAALKGAGKTTICLEAIAYNQYLASISGTKFRVLYIDFEKNLVRQQDLAVGIGADLTDEGFYYRQPMTLEGGFQYVIECLKPHTRKMWLGIDEPLDLVVVDTLAAARPRCEIDNKLGNSNKPGYRGKLCAEFFRNVQADLGSDGPAVVVINHLQQTIDMNAKTWGPPQYDSPGSNALKLYAAQRYFLKRNEKLDFIRDVEDPYTYEKTKQIYTISVEVECEKSKIGPPYRKGSYVIRPGVGIDKVITMFVAAERKAGALYNANNAHFGVPDPKKKGDLKDQCPERFVGRFPFLEHLIDSPRDSKQLAANLNPLWVQQMDTYWEMRNRIKGLEKKVKAGTVLVDAGSEIPDEDSLTLPEGAEPSVEAADDL